MQRQRHVAPGTVKPPKDVPVIQSSCLQVLTGKCADREIETPSRGFDPDLVHLSAVNLSASESNEVAITAVTPA
jgi:hypothetical protein